MYECIYREFGKEIKHKRFKQIYDAMNYYIDLDLDTYLFFNYSFVVDHNTNEIICGCHHAIDSYYTVVIGFGNECVYTDSEMMFDYISLETALSIYKSVLSNKDKFMGATYTALVKSGGILRGEYFGDNIQ